MVNTPVEILIEGSPAEVRVAILDLTGKLLRFFRSLNCRPSKTDGVYRGRLSAVDKVSGGGFVDLDEGKTAYLPQTRGFTEGQDLIVQVVRDEHKGKSAVVTTIPTLRGRYVSLQPQRDGIHIERGVPKSKVGKKLTDIRDLFKKGRITIRGPGAVASLVEIRDELKFLARKWEEIRDIAVSAKPPAMLMTAPEISKRILRDTSVIEQVLIGDRNLFYKINKLTKYWPDLEGRITFLRDQTNIFEVGDTESQWLAALDREVPLEGGGRITIDETEALIAIDVDSARAQGKSDAIRRINLAAMSEIAHQICLRNLAGLIIIDPISMSNRRHRKELVDILRRAMKGDNRVTDILGMTPGGLIEMTRQRVGATLNEEFLAKKATDIHLTATCEAADLLRRALTLQGLGRLTVVAHSDIISELRGMLSGALAETERRIGQSLVLRVDNEVSVSNIYFER
ncbi:MAG: hypothetical protein CMM41_00660 [Rhodospirillaceae bacterium]|nr:hypothetical protein [Rhodospirillaceae bacterium]